MNCPKCKGKLIHDYEWKITCTKCNVNWYEEGYI